MKHPPSPRLRRAGGLNTDVSEKMYPAGFYRTNLRAISLKEMMGRYGILRLPIVYFFTRFGRIKSPGYWMPQLRADLECDQQALSEQFWQRTAKHREAMEKLGFVGCGFSRLKDEFNLNPLNTDNGKVIYIHKNKAHIALVIYHKTRVPEPVNKDKEVTVAVFTAAYPIGSLSCSNARGGFEPNPDEQVIRIRTGDVFALYDTFLNALKRKPEQPLTFSTPVQMQQLFDERLIKRFENRVARGLFVKMTDEEIAEARRKKPPPLPMQE